MGKKRKKIVANFHETTITWDNYSLDITTWKVSNNGMEHEITGLDIKKGKLQIKFNNILVKFDKIKNLNRVGLVSLRDRFNNWQEAQLYNDDDPNYLYTPLRF